MTAPHHFIVPQILRGSPPQGDGGGAPLLPVTLAALLIPGAATACALPPSVILTLPTDLFIAAGAATVAVTAALGALAGRLPPMVPRLVWDRPVLVPRDVTSLIAFMGFLALCLVGLTGARDPMHNLMSLVFWTGVWVALPLTALILGHVWRPLNPWFAPVRIMRALMGWRGSIGLARAGYWPAVLGQAGFAWFMLVSLRPEDPAVLAQVALLYWAAIFVLSVLEGEDWLERGEFLTVLFGMIARVAPFWLETDGRRARLMAGWPGTQVLAMPPLPPSGIAFVTVALGTLTFDGLAETFWWMALIGENPLEFTGRSAVTGVNTAGLVAAWALTGATILGAIALGRAIGGRGFATGPVMLSFLAIAAGYHAAHYLVTLLTAGQYTLAALNDPLFRGDAYLGLPPFWVSYGFLADRGAMIAVYAAQFAAILGAHLLAVVLSLHLVSRAGVTRASAHLPMTLLMVGYTMMGLWLLSTARIG